MNKKIKNILVNKIFIFIILFIAIIFNFIPFCYASSFSCSCNNKSFNVSFPSFFNSYNYAVFSLEYNGSFYRYCIFLSDYPFYCVDGHGMRRSDDGKMYYYEGTLFSYTSEIDLSDIEFSSFTTPYSVSLPTSASDIKFSTFDVYTTSGDLVFQAAPQPQGETQQETQQGNNQEVEQTQGTQQEETQQQEIPTLTTVEQIPQAIIQTLQTLIPIGLVVFGIGLVIYLMRLLILRLM